MYLAVVEAKRQVNCLTAGSAKVDDNGKGGAATEYANDGQ